MARFGDGYDGFQVAVTTEGVIKNRGALGRFVSPEVGYREMEQTNRAAALAVQADVVDNIRRSIIRRKVSTGRLVKATASDENRYYTRFGWGVGDEAYLDQSIAKYWRQIEEGTDIHVGREIKGIWGSSIRGFYDNHWGRVASGGPPYSASGAGVSDKFVPRANGRYFDARTGRTSTWRGPGMERFRPTTIENPIEPMGAYDQAWHDAGRWVEKSAEAALQMLTNYALKNITGY